MDKIYKQNYKRTIRQLGIPNPQHISHLDITHIPLYNTPVSKWIADKQQGAYHA